MGEEEPKKKRVVVESLGWLTESTIMPKKHRAIAGVGASSIMELKAQLYQSQEDSKKSKDLAGPDIEFHRAKKKITAHDAFSAKNSGVDTRAHKDKLELKAVKDGSASYAALEKKAALYDKLAKPMGLGQAGATWDNDEHKRFVREVHQEANQAREKASELKVRRQEQATARREKLKQAYIRKQLEKLKAAASNKEET
ncbi:hypothetical protein M0R45_013575 [Rubus argutus]|uniref:Uncharacterized protein n=1 Tax=Rubus argutus TaxID=59490 RepID=A0AAW1XKX8_RUBAR